MECVQWLGTITTSMTQPEAQAEFDTERVVTRFAFASLVCALYILSFHGFSREVVPPTCAGGWSETIQFVAAFVLTGLLIEFVQWALWSIWQLHGPSWKRYFGPGSDSVMLDGGGLCFLPRKSLWIIPFAFACFFVFLWTGTPNPCEDLNFTWKGALGSFCFAFAALGFGSFAEF